jgi:uracil-DNA glycosylase family 4
MDLLVLNDTITACRACPRLVEWREKVGSEKRKSYSEETYWAKPVPNFLPDDADDPTHLIVGLAPAAHGANRTGRMFTGDRSGDWLYRALHKVGAASQPTSTSHADGLMLNKTCITAVCHCAPPDNKPTPDELRSCQSFLQQTWDAASWRAVLCLGSIAWNAVMDLNDIRPRPKFSHGAEVELSSGTVVYGSYHPSQQNTFTGRLTEEMLDAVIASWWARC